MDTLVNVMPGYYRRMQLYFEEMYPVTQRLLLAILLYCSIAELSAQFYQRTWVLFSLHSAVGVLSLFGQMLILRLMDEIKDQAIDNSLFPERPVPSGRVYLVDIKVSLVIVVICYLVINSLIDNTIWSAIAALIYMLLMFVHFFRRSLLESSLPITLLTHNPIIALFLFHTCLVVTSALGVSFDNLDRLFTGKMIVMFWASFLAWELARKIRKPWRETDYVTYSQLLGLPISIITLLTVQLLSVSIALHFYWDLSAPWFFPIILIIGYMSMVWAGLNFLLTAEPSYSLGRCAEWFIVCLLLAVIIGLFPGLGVDL